MLCEPTLLLANQLNTLLKLYVSMYKIDPDSYELDPDSYEIDQDSYEKFHQFS